MNVWVLAFIMFVRKLIQIEPRKLVLRNKDQVRQSGKDETLLARFCKIPLSYQSSNLSLLGILS